MPDDTLATVTLAYLIIYFILPAYAVTHCAYPRRDDRIGT